MYMGALESSSRRTVRGCARPWLSRSPPRTAQRGLHHTQQRASLPTPLFLLSCRVRTATRSGSVSTLIVWLPAAPQYARDHVQQHLEAHYCSGECQEDIQAIRQQVCMCHMAVPGNMRHMELDTHRKQKLKPSLGSHSWTC